jgi:phi13 family phage major tail protein
MADNKVVFGLRNAHYSIITEGEDGEISYSVPVSLKGAVEVALDPRGETTDFYADDILYYTTVSNQGYEMTLTVANIPVEFRTDVLGENMEGADNVLTETPTSKSKKIAFMFEFDGDIKAVRHCLYYCTVTRPSISSATKTESAEPQTQELTVISAPRPEDGVVKRSTTAETPDGVYNAWYQNVYVPAVV